MAELALDFVSPIIKFAVSKAISLAAAQISMAWGLEKQLGELAQTLTMIQGLLEDAEGRQESNPAIRNWLQKLRDVAYDAVDVLDEYDYEVLKHKVQTQGRKRKQVRTFFGFFNRTAFRLSMADKIRKINKTLVTIKDNGALLLPVRLSDQSRSAASARQYPKTDSIPDCLKFVGRHNDVLEIVNKLDDIRSQHILSGISIVGLGGIGKTTLAKSICSMVKEQKLYDLVAWVCVSEEFDEKIVLGDMLEYLDSSAGQMNNIDALIQKLGQKLENRKFLLVLDDVWNDDRDKWDSFKSHLLKILKTSGNSILVTTRSYKVASIMEALPMQKHAMVKLSYHECWLIIEDVVLRSSTETSIPLDLEVIGQEIAKKCGGLPLVASVIGGALSRELKTDKWQEILDDGAWILQDENKKILSILKISFDRLPSSLKKCFSYCSIFPKGAVIFKDDLIQLWMAQGFVHKSNESLVDMEDIGEEYFNELLSNAFFQDITWDLYGNIKSCKMHYLVHNLALLVSKGEILVWNTSSNFDVQNCSTIRHLRVQSNGKDLPTIPRSVAQRLHSLFSNVDVFCSMASDLKSLRSLKLMGVCGKKLPTSLGKLKHLKYFDISGTHFAMPESLTIPESFSKLYNLQSLKCVNCYYVEWPPNAVGNLISLRHIYCDDRLDISILQLTSLQTLVHFVVRTKRGCQIEDRRCLSQLGELEIWKLEHVRSKLEASKVNLKEKTNLHQLALYWGGRYGRAVNNNNNDEEVLEGLQPHSNLKSLAIVHYMGKRFPSWMGNDASSSSSSFLLYNMVELRLCYCNECTCIPSLGLLPSLKVLYISGMENVRRMGHKLQPGGAESIRLFPALKELAVRGMKRLKEWVEVVDDVAAGSQGVIVFPCLEKLLISECPLLKTWSMGGFSSHHKLSKLRIDRCSNLTAIPGLDGLSALEKLELLSCDGLTSLPIGLGSCISLQLLEIGECRNLNSIPSIHGLTSLETLKLVHCDGLTSLPIGLGSCISLQLLEIRKCRNLNSIPSINGLTSLETLKLFHCDGLTSLAIELESCISLQWLEVRKCPNLNSIPSINGPTSLQTLKLFHCDGLTSLPIRLGSCISLQSLEIKKCQNLKSIPSISEPTSLKTLKLFDCDGLTSLPIGLGSCISLQSLEIRKCQNLNSIPSINGPTSLKTLKLFDCDGLTSLPIGLESCISLHLLEIERCRNLNSIPSINGLTSLETLKLFNCDGLTCLPIGLDSCISLNVLSIWNCKNLRSIPEDIGKLHSLNVLSIWNCKNLRSIPGESLASLTCLKGLGLGSFWSKLEDFPGLTSIHQLHASLEKLELHGWDKLESLPHQLQHLTALKELTLTGFNGWEALPEWFRDLSSLHRLGIGNCSNLTHLPSIEAMRRLSNLQYLLIWNCPKLKKRCAKKRDPEWSKISHIPNIRIHDKDVQGKFKYSWGMFSF
ncbi:hypothetical protein SLA2020_056590 [Shorea laevis]